MKSKLTKLDGTSRQFNIEVAKELVEKAFDEVLADIRKEATVPGFRKGNAPMDMIRKNYMKDAQEEVKRRLIPEAYQSALDEHKVTPVSYPEIWDVKFEMSGTMTFKAKTDGHPVFELAKYRDIKVLKKAVAVEESEVDEAISRMRNMFAELAEVERPVGKGDFALCDEEVFLEGKLLGKKREKVVREADKDSTPFGIGEKLLGMKTGETKEIEVDVPKDYQVKEYAGKKLVFKIEIKGVREKKVPALDDELAKKLGQEKVEDLRKDIRDRIKEGKESDSRLSLKDQIVEYLLKKHSFELPPTMVSRQLEVLVSRAEDELRQKGMDKGAIDSYKEEMRKKLLENARDKVKLYFILDKISEAENITVSDGDIDDWLKALSASLNKPFEGVKKYYEDNDLIGGLDEQLKEEKTLDFLLEAASVAEK